MIYFNSKYDIIFSVENNEAYSLYSFKFKDSQSKGFIAECNIRLLIDPLSKKSTEEDKNNFRNKCSNIDEDFKAASEAIISHSDFANESNEVFYSGIIDRMFVNEDFRRKGIGSEILQNLPDIFLRCYNIKLKQLVLINVPDLSSSHSIKEMNEITTNFYIKNGYRKCKGCFYQFIRY